MSLIDISEKIDKKRLDAIEKIAEIAGSLKIDPNLFKPLIVLPIKGYRKLDPSGPRRGPCNGRWMIQENLPGKINQ